MLLEIKNLKVLFHPSMAAADGVNLSVAEGSFTALVGESGSGKSVTALSIGRLLRPFSISGEIYFRSGSFKDKNILKLPETEMIRIRGREIAYVFQDPGSSLNPVMRIGGQITEVGPSRERAMEFLRKVRIKDVERVYKSFPHELSGGMKQRAMLAMALVSEPKLLIADEPTTALDVTTEREILDLLAEIQKARSLAVLFITHDLSLALRHADLLFVMQKGVVVEHLVPQNGQIFPEHPYTKRLFAARAGLREPKTLIELL